jgi:uncharacterized membrane protein
MTTPRIDLGKALPEDLAAALAYVTFVPAVVFLFLAPYNQSYRIRFHAWQSVLLTIAMFVTSFLLTVLTIFGMLFGAYAVLEINGVVWLLWLTVWIICIVQAFKGKCWRVPVLGRIADRQARQ